MAGFRFRLERTVCRLRRQPLRYPFRARGLATRSMVRGRTLRVIGKRDDDADHPPVLVVQEV
jgi:hypothetical protein